MKFTLFITILIGTLLQAVAFTELSTVAPSDSNLNERS